MSRRIYGPPVKEDRVVFSKVFFADGLKKTWHQDVLGNVWIEGEDGVRTQVRVLGKDVSDFKGEVKMVDFPELDELSVTEQGPSDKVEDTKPTAEKMAFLGVGQAGCKIADAFWEKGYKRVLLVNTTEQDMAGLQCPNRVIIGKNKTGAGKNPEVGEKAAQDAQEEVLRSLYKAFGTDLERVMVCTSSGGGTGSGAAPVMVEVASKYMDSLGLPVKVGVIASGPKKSEGAAVKANNDRLMKKLSALVQAKKISPLILMDNDRISKLFPKANIVSFFSIANKNIVGLMDVFNCLASQSSPYSTLDPADYKSILDSGVITLGMNTIAQAEDATAMAAAVQKNVGGGLLSEAAKLEGATHAGAILVATKAKLETLPQTNLDLAFETLGRLIGSQGLMLHSGIYEGPESLDNRVLMYTIVGGLKWTQE